jgi:hypothetical protein
MRKSLNTLDQNINASNISLKLNVLINIFNCNSLAISLISILKSSDVNINKSIDSSLE